MSASHSIVPDLVPPGRHPLRRALVAALGFGMDAVAYGADALTAYRQSREHDALHDARLIAARRHLVIVRAAIVAGHPEVALPHIGAAAVCIRDAERHDAAEDGRVEAMAGLVERIGRACRAANGLLDRLLGGSARHRRPATSASGRVGGREGLQP